jgi:light-harvesting complex I chlorophyll a/b binding protein 1
MKSVAAFAMLASSAAAFAPSTSDITSTTALSAGNMPDRLWNSMVDKNERSRAVPFLPRAINLDGTAPADYGFDPFYLSSIPKNFAGFLQPPSWEAVKGLPTLYWMRESEVKHGRVAMLAVVGWIATDLGLRFPGAGAPYTEIPNAYLAHNTLVDQGSMTVMLLAAGLIEVTTGAALVQVAKGDLTDREPGEFNFDPLNLMGKTEDSKKTMMTKEINNGRLAMLAFGGIATQTALDNGVQTFPYF